MRVFDFGLAALPQLAKPRKGRKGEAAADAAQRLQKEWTNDDPLKQPTRAAFISFALALVSTADAQLLPEVLTLRPLIGGTLHFLSSDPPSAQVAVLRVLRKLVAAKRTAAGAFPGAEVLGDAALGQLAAIAASGPEGSLNKDEAPEGDNSHAHNVESSSNATLEKDAADLAFEILHAAVTDHRLGLCCPPSAAFTLTLAAAQLTHGQRRLVRWLQSLRPADSSSHGALIAAATEHDSALAAAMLLSLPYSLEPTATGRWLTHVGVVGGLLQAVANSPVGLAALAER